MTPRYSSSLTVTVTYQLSRLLLHVGTNHRTITRSSVPGCAQAVVIIRKLSAAGSIIQYITRKSPFRQRGDRLFISLHCSTNKTGAFM